VVTRVISGGQTGVDQAALRAAETLGLETGGWCPPGARSEAGPIPARYLLRETPEERSDGAPDVPRSLRTEWNVRDSDATLIVARHTDRPLAGGTAWAATCAADLGKPLLICDLAASDATATARTWLRSTPIRVLNVAGPSESECPGIEGLTYAFLLDILES
jgi:hypothetical protein